MVTSIIVGVACGLIAGYLYSLFVLKETLRDISSREQKQREWEWSQISRSNEFAEASAALYNQGYEKGYRDAFGQNKKHYDN